MAADIPLTEAKLVGNFLATLLFGFHTIAFGFGLRCLLWDKKGARKDEIHWIMLTAGIIIWLLGSFDVSLSLYENIRAFVLYDGPGGPEAAFILPVWSGTVRGWIFFGDALVGDYIMIYRCWIVWNRSWLVVALPLLLIVAELGTGLTSLIWQIVIPPNVILTHTGQVLTAVSLSNWAITCTLTLLTMIFIVIRIWQVERSSAKLLTTGSSKSSRGDALRYAIRIIMESGLIYSATILTLLIVYGAGSIGAYPMTDTVPQIVGISFNLIIVRATSHSEHSTTYSVTGEYPKFAVPLRRRDRSTTFGATSLGDTSQGDEHPSSPLEISLVERNQRGWDVEKDGKPAIGDMTQSSAV